VDLWDGVLVKDAKYTFSDLELVKKAQRFQVHIA
jgi:hypothetical protein